MDSPHHARVFVVCLSHVVAVRVFVVAAAYLVVSVRIFVAVHLRPLAAMEVEDDRAAVVVDVDVSGPALFFFFFLLFFPRFYNSPC